MGRTARRRPLRLTALLAALLLVTVSCGGDDGNDSSAGGTGGGGNGGNGDRPELPECPLDALDAATGPVEITVWHSYTAVTEETLLAMAADFNANQDKVVVKIENQSSYEELWRKYQQGIANNQLPTIAIPDDSVTRQIVDSATVLPAESCIEASGYDPEQLLDVSRSYYTIDDVLYPASLNTSAPLLYYNKNHFRKAGLDPEQTPGTLAELREYAQAIKDAGVVDTPIVLNLSGSIIEMLLTGAGIPMVDNDNGRGEGETTASTYADARTVELYTWLRDMVDDGLLLVVPVIDNQFEHYLAMASQSASMTIETSTAATSVEAFLKGDLDTGDLPTDAGGAAEDADVDLEALDIGAGLVPGIDEPGQLQVGGGAWYITLAGTPEQQAAAWSFMTWFNEPPQQARWSAEGSYMPYNVNAFDEQVLKDAWSGERAGAWLTLAYEELTTGVDPEFPGPLLGPYEQFRAAQREAVDSLVFGDGDPAAVVQEVQDKTTEAIDQYNAENF